MANTWMTFNALFYYFISFYVINSQEHHNTLENLKQDIWSRSQESEIFRTDEHKQSESTYNNGTQYYTNLRQTMEQGDKLLETSVSI